jgi:hypothetical protein
MNSKHVGVGISLGLCFGAAFGAALHTLGVGTAVPNVGVGIALGVSLGAVYGAAFGPASDAESARKKVAADKPPPHPLGL